jgi:hypothetical protein
MKTLILSLIFCLINSFSSAQDNSITRNSFVSAGIPQIKESANFGLVFRGPAFNYGMNWLNKNEKRIFSYEFELGAGVLFSRDIPGISFHLKPVDLAYMFKFPFEVKNLYIGPSFEIDYSYNLYPDLQAGFDYWLTDFNLGIGALYDFNVKKSSVRIKLKSSVLGFVSRQPAYRDPYFYDIGFKYAIKHLNQDLLFGSWDKFNNTQLEISCRFKQDSRFSFGYVFDYSDYFEDPEITIITHSIKLIIGKNKN